MEQISQKTIEHFFADHNVVNPDQKAKILPLITDLIYDYNMHVVRLEKEQDDYKKQQIITGINEINDKITENIKSVIDQV
jgi:hypothetical protein